MAGNWRDLDGLRAVAIVLVVAAHARVPGMQAGVYGVDVFFVLSGFLITRNLLGWTGGVPGPERRAAWRMFLARRAVRLGPALTVALLLLAGWVWATGPERGLACLALAAGQAMNLPAGQACPGPLHVTWSLAAEQQYYLLWPAVLLALARVERPDRAVAVGYAVAAAVSAAVALTVGGAATWLNYAPPGRSLALLAGSALALAHARTGGLRPGGRPGRAAWFAANTGWAAAALAAAVAGAAVALAAGAAPVLGGTPVAVASVWLVAALRTGPPGRVAAVLSGRLMVWLGQASYSLYLLHLLGLHMARDALPGRPVLATAVGVAGSVAAAAALRGWVEEPCRVRGNAWLAGRFPARPAQADMRQATAAPGR